jgi:Holliday junction DNA helicase RuvB
MANNFIKLINGNTHGEVCPETLNGVIGQSDAKKTLDFFIRSHSHDVPFPTLLFTGGHGLGKTYFSSLVTKSLNRKMIEINCGKIKTTKEFVDIILSRVVGNECKTILLDEGHELSDDITTLLLTMLNPNSENVNYIPYLNNTNLIWDLTKINVIMATTDAYQIFKPLRNRCQEIYFYPYNEKDLYRIVKMYTKGIKLKCDKTELAYLCRSRARDAYVVSQNIIRHTNMKKDKDFCDKDLEELKNFLGYFPMGLKKNEIELLKIIQEESPISSANLAIRLMINESNVKEELEVRLRELGFINSTTKGRVVTDKGENYLKNLTSC